MNIKIITVGRLKETYLKDAVKEYEKRLTRYAKISVIEVADEKAEEDLSEAEAAKILDTEGARIEKYIKDGDYVIGLAIEGNMLDSEGFSKKLSNLMTLGKSDICFIIGGSIGMSDRLKKRSDMLLSFSRMTFPHQLMRVILLEQVYRAYRIMYNEPYHK